MNLTASQERALRILDGVEWPGILPSQFAELMWPDSPKWQTVYHVGNGAVRGAAVNRAGGAYLGKLVKRGWAQWNFHDKHSWYQITNAGRRALRP